MVSVSLKDWKRQAGHEKHRADEAENGIRREAARANEWERRANGEATRANREAGRADEYRERAKQHAARAAEMEQQVIRERAGAEFESTRANDLGKFLHEIDRIVLNQAEELRATRPKFLHDVQQISGNAPDRVGVLIREFQFHFNRTRVLQQDIDRLIQEKIMLQAEVIQMTHQNRITLATNDFGSSSQSPQVVNGNNFSELTNLSHDLDEVLNIQKLKHEREIQDIQISGQERIEELLTIHQSNLAELKASHDEEKDNLHTMLKAENANQLTKLQASYNAESARHQSRLQGEKEIEISRLQTAQEAEKRRASAEHLADMERLQTTLHTVHEGQIKNCQASHNAELRQLQSDLEEERDQSHKSHIEEMKRLQNTLNGRHRAEIEEIEAFHDDDVRQLRGEHEADKKKLQASLRADHEAEITRLETARNIERKRLRAEHDADKNRFHTELQSAYETETKRLQLDHEAVKGRLLAQNSTLKTKISDMHNWHKTETGRLVQDHEEKERLFALQVSDLEQYHEEATKEMENGHKLTMAKMEQQYNSQVLSMTQEHESQNMSLLARISRMEKDFALKVDEMKKDFEDKKRQLTHDITQEHARLEAEFKLKEGQVKASCANEIQRLRQEVMGYSEALLVRDEFLQKTMPDNEIKDRFLSLAKEVETLARLEWKVNQTQWTSEVLRSLSSNLRTAKKFILQDNIWVILNEFVFCSPFRIMGEEGQELEKQWSKQPGGSEPNKATYSWPEPAMETERWRHVTIKECCAALRQPVPSKWDPRAKLKMGFKSSTEGLKDELTSAIGDVANLDDSTVHAIAKLTKKAANMWLEFGMQRCRIRVILHGSNLMSTEEKIHRADDILELVVVPELKRFGNSKGQFLNIEEIVGGCEGETVKLSTKQRFSQG